MKYFIFVTLIIVVIFILIGFLVLAIANSFILSKVDDDWALDIEGIGLCFLLAFLFTLIAAFIFLILGAIMGLETYILNEYVSIYLHHDFFNLLTYIFLVLLFATEYFILSYKGFFLKSNYDNCKYQIRNIQRILDNTRNIEEKTLEKLENQLNAYKTKKAKLEIKLNTNGFGSYI